MAPPAKRRKTNVIADSDDEAEDQQSQANTLSNFLFSSPQAKASESRGPTASPSPTKSRTTRATRTTTRNGGKDDARSPGKTQEKKARAGKKFKTEDTGKSADLLTLFSKQAQKPPSTSVPRSNGNLLDDIVSDPISDEDEVAATKPSSSSFVGQNARKRARDNASIGSSVGTGASNKFLRPPRAANAASVDDDLRPWSERFAPVNLDELAVHKKKVADVRRWLEDVMGGRSRQRLLLLKGAAGSGKTTTMRLLARDLGCELLEWRNPSGAMNGNLGYSSASIQFQEFLGRGGKFGQLEVDVTDSEPSSASSEKTGHKSQKRIMLVEEFPNTFARSSTALTSFRNAVLGYLAATTPALSSFGRQPLKDPVVPVVMVVSETLLTTTSASADSFTAHRLLGPEILRHPGTAVIEFNAIAPSILAKALESVVLKEARKSGRKRTPGPAVLKRLGEIGDIRSAISSLEFLCLKGDQDADWGAKVAFSKPKRGGKDSVAMTKGEEESLEMISQREASLGIFHAVGKVMYNKRDEQPPPNDTVESLPSFLAHHARPKRSEVSVDTLIDETGTDTHTFVSALHENYPLSCEKPSPLDPHSSLDYINGCLDYLSESDLLCPSWDIFFGGRGGFGSFGGRDTGSHILRQDEMTFQVAVRGLLFSLPSPVKRKAPHGARGGDAFKMFYPTSIKLWRSKEEFEGLVDVWSTKLLKGEEDAPRKDLTQGAAAFRRPKPIGSASGASGSWVATQQSRAAAAVPPANSAQRDNDDDNQAGEGSDGAVPLLSLGSSARREMLMERLPYMAQIARGRPGAFHSIKLRDIEKVVSFQGIGAHGLQIGDESGDEAAEEESGGAGMGVPATGEAWATDRPTEESSPRKKKAGIRTRSDGSVSGLAVQGLVLSDDDIEDD